MAEPSGGTGRGAIARTAAALLACSLLGAACGQFEGVHREAIVGAERPVVDASPNGENSGPVSSVRYTVIEVVTRLPRPRGDGPLFACPVRGPGFFADDFGAPRYSGGYHPHQGNDMFAARGTPVVAPFDGTATATPNLLGGLAVKVYGADGYVYNAHLAAYGKLGRVEVGDVVGYVGATGNALGGPPHNHFEWHPGNGPAVDPHELLREVC